MPSPTVVFNKWSRRLHRWGGLAAAIPVGLVIATGLLLQVKKQWAWVQPPMATSAGGEPGVSLPALLDAARGVPEAGVDTWDDIHRIDIRPGDGVAKVTSRTRWEVQVDAATGEVLQVAYRRSDLIESLHDGSFFGQWAKMSVFLGAGLVLASLWLTGLWLWWMPHAARRRRARLAGGETAPGPGPA